MPSSEWTAIAQSLLKSQEAIQADHGGDYLKAAKMYKEAILMIDAHVLACINDEEREKLIEIITSYSNRVDLIYRSIPELTNEVPTDSFDFEESLPIGSPPESPPASLLRRPYWLMKLLMQTMTRGGYLTPKLYVPRNVWFQTGAKFTAIEAKFTSCETILIYLQKLKDENTSDPNMFAKELEEFGQQMDTIQNVLARKLRFINEIKTDKNVTKLALVGNKISKTVERLHSNVMKLKIDDDTAYINLLIKVFETSQHLEQVLIKCETDGNTFVLSKMKRISDFFYSVLCAFVIRDFNMLLDRYMRKTRGSFNDIVD